MKLTKTERKSYEEVLDEDGREKLRRRLKVNEPKVEIELAKFVKHVL